MHRVASREVLSLKAKHTRQINKGSVMQISINTMLTSCESSDLVFGCTLPPLVLDVLEV